MGPDQGQIDSASNLLTVNTAPCGSRKAATRVGPASEGGAITVPPSSTARVAIASVSSTVNVTLQWDGTSSENWSLVIGRSPATTSSKPGGALISACRVRRSGSLFSRKSPYPGRRKNVNSVPPPVNVSVIQPNTAP